MRIAVTGSRYLTNKHFNKVEIEGTDGKYICRTLTDILSGILHDLFEDGDQLIFIEGGSNGADKLCKEWCKSNGILHEEYPAHWDIGKSAGPLRNQEMAEKCDYCLAFPIIGLNNKGTLDMIQRCQALGKHVDIYWMEV